MTLFYKNLKAGKSKDAALRDAKLGYISTHFGERAHPFFWAGIVGVGAMDGIEVR
jgi:CHAT domain-containing protein